MARSTDPLASLLADDHGESLFDALDDVQFWIKDRAGRYLRVNRALLRNYGFADAAAVVGKRDDELFPPHLAQQYQGDDRQVLAGRPLRDRVELVARPDRTAGWHLTNKVPLRGRDGRVVATAGITRDIDASAVALAPFDRLGPVVEHLRRHYHLPLDKRRLARFVGRSVRSLERAFASAFGTSVLQYQRKLRLHHACRSLVDGAQPITAIALAVGYGDHSHFTRDFRRAFAMSPRAYRRRWARTVEL
ncbi:MAG TPA: AraC family transcriptional regulator [Planctomycetota bacterium]|nr:AraC family transcriptional regulator [Planctomycetota bacterium]